MYKRQALYYYEQVLKQDANNQQAKRGIQKIADLYRQRTQSAVDAEQYSQASTNLEILSAVDPSDPQIPEFQNAILRLLNIQEKALEQSAESTE